MNTIDNLSCEGLTTFRWTLVDTEILQNNEIKI